MSEKLATAKTISFTAASTYESPAINGQPLYYTTISQVYVRTVRRKNCPTPRSAP